MRRRISPGALSLGDRSPSHPIGSRRWPLTNNTVTLHCEVSGKYKYATFDARGKTYALNGSARDAAYRYGWIDLEKVWTSDGAGGNVDPSDLVYRGVQLCG